MSVRDVCDVAYVVQVDEFGRDVFDAWLESDTRPARADTVQDQILQVMGLRGVA